MHKTARMMALPLLMALAACAAATQMVADQQPILSPRLDCRLDESAPLDFGGFVAAPASYSGHCVHARGIIAFRRFYPDALSLYAKRNASELVAVYGNDLSEDGESLWIVRKPVDLVGYTYTCEQ